MGKSSRAYRSREARRCIPPPPPLHLSASSLLSADKGPTQGGAVRGGGCIRRGGRGQGHAQARVGARSRRTRRPRGAPRRRRSSWLGSPARQVNKNKFTERERAPREEGAMEVDVARSGRAPPGASDVVADPGEARLRRVLGATPGVAFKKSAHKLCAALGVPRRPVAHAYASQEAAGDDAGPSQRAGDAQDEEGTKERSCALRGRAERRGGRPGKCRAVNSRNVCCATLSACLRSRAAAARARACRLLQTTLQMRHRDALREGGSPLLFCRCCHVGAGAHPVCVAVRRAPGAPLPPRDNPMPPSRGVRRDASAPSARRHSPPSPLRCTCAARSPTG